MAVVKEDAVLLNIPEESGEGLLQQDLHPMALDDDWKDWFRSNSDSRLEDFKPDSDSCSLYRVPVPLFAQHEESYKPQIISIGPYREYLEHEHEREKFSRMEEHKWRYVHNIIPPGEDCFLQKLLSVVLYAEDEACKCYSEEMKQSWRWYSWQHSGMGFVGTMLLDGCFIVELFRRATGKGNLLPDDSLLKLELVRDMIARDLILLENQIPFLVLQKLFDQMNIGGPSLVRRALDFFGNSLQINFLRDRLYDIDINFKPGHLLDLLHRICFPLDPAITKGEHYKRSIPCASELKRAGIKFKKGNLNSFSDIKFLNGVVKFPPSSVHEHVGTLFFNLIAFEQYYHRSKRPVTMYVHFMKSLIDTPEDVEILTQEGIIENRLGSSKDVVIFFKQLGSQLVLSDENHYLQHVWKGVNQYYEVTYHRWRAS